VPASGGVLDASVLLAAILNEMTVDEAAPWFANACVSTVNLSEVVARLSDLGYANDFIAEGLVDLDVEVRPFDRAQAERAGLLRPVTHQAGLSFGDRACLAPAAELGRSAVTADRAWAKLDIGIPIELIG
jgi:PIN domain nuclease of toxin-antitoxin system